MVRTCSLLFFSRALTKAILFGNEFNSHSCCSALPSDNTPELISCIILSVCFMVLLQEIRPEVYAPPIFAHCKNIGTETGNPTPFNFAQPNASLKIRALNKTFLSFYLLLPLPDWEKQHLDLSSFSGRSLDLQTADLFHCVLKSLTAVPGPRDPSRLPPWAHTSVGIRLPDLPGDHM